MLTDSFGRQFAAVARSRYSIWHDGQAGHRQKRISALLQNRVAMPKLAAVQQEAGINDSFDEVCAEALRDIPAEPERKIMTPDQTGRVPLDLV